MLDEVDLAYLPLKDNLFVLIGIQYAEILKIYVEISIDLTFEVLARIWHTHRFELGHLFLMLLRRLRRWDEVKNLSWNEGHLILSWD